MRYAKRSKSRKFGRRMRRTLSTRNIFSNKGARSQAKQISALSKRIRSVARYCAPEVKVLESYNSGITYDNRGFAAPGTNGQVQWLKIPIPMNQATPAIGAGDNQRIGNLIKIKPIKLYTNIQYRELYNSLTSGFATVKLPLQSSGIQLRLVALQTKMTEVAEPLLSDVFENNGYDGVDPVAAGMMMTMPFKTGITARFNILMDKRITVSQDKPVYSRRITIYPKIKSLRWEEQNEGPPRGAIYVFVLSSGWSTNEYYSGDTNIEDFNQAWFTWAYRMPYTDA